MQSRLLRCRCLRSAFASAIDRHNRVELFRELRHVAVVVIGAAHVNQLRCLFLNRFHDFRMAMSGRTDRDAGVAVEKNVAVDVFNPNAAGTFGDELEGRSRVRGVNKLCICFDDFLAVGTGQRRLDLGRFDGASTLVDIFSPLSEWPINRQTKVRPESRLLKGQED
jgi:hypothetical protein